MTKVTHDRLLKLQLNVTLGSYYELTNYESEYNQGSYGNYTAIHTLEDVSTELRNHFENPSHDTVNDMPNYLKET